MQKLISEYEKIKTDNYQLSFKYPTAGERATLRTVNRDTSKTQRDRSRKSIDKVQQLISELEREDYALPDRQRDALIRIIDEKGKL